MSESNTTKGKTVTVVGAGFAGLASAFYLSRAGFDVEVYESTSRAGGLLGTIETSFGLVETGANALLNSARVEELFGLLNLPLQRVQPEARKRFIFRGSPKRWPVGIKSSLHVGYFLLRYFIYRKSVRPRVGESLRAWGTRTIGREASVYLLEPAMQGIYAGDPEKLSARLLLEAVFNTRSRPAPGTFRGSVSAERGMGELIEKWRAQLERFGVRFYMDRAQGALERQPSRPMVLAVPPPMAALILREVDGSRASALASIEMLPLASTTVAFRDPPRRGAGFGCLFPKSEGRLALGALMNSLIFPGRSKRGFSETWIIGGAEPRQRKVLEQSDEELLETISEERQTVFNASGDRVAARITRWPQALPHYTAVLEAALPELTGLRHNIVLNGNYLGGVGLAKILERAARLPDLIKASGEWRDA